MDKLWYIHKTEYYSTMKREWTVNMYNNISMFSSFVECKNPDKSYYKSRSNILWFHLYKFLEWKLPCGLRKDISCYIKEHKETFGSDELGSQYSLWSLFQCCSFKLPEFAQIQRRKRFSIMDRRKSNGSKSKSKQLCNSAIRWSVRTSWKQ